MIQIKTIRVFRILAMLVVLHGLFCLLMTQLVARFMELPDWIAFICFMGLFLEWPFDGLLAAWGMIQSPGWISYPTLLGMVLVYGIWIGGLLALDWIMVRFFSSN